MKVDQPEQYDEIFGVPNDYQGMDPGFEVQGAFDDLDDSESSESEPESEIDSDSIKYEDGNASGESLSSRSNMQSNGPEFVRIYFDDDTGTTFRDFSEEEFYSVMNTVLEVCDADTKKHLEILMKEVREINEPKEKEKETTVVSETLASSDADNQIDESVSTSASCSKQDN